MNKIGASNIVIIILLLFTVLASWILLGNSDLEKSDDVKIEDVSDVPLEGSDK